MASSIPPPLHLLVTAGPTREKIDAVRDWGNIFTGQTGLDLAVAFLQLGCVTLLTSNPDHARDFDGYSAGRGMIGTELFRSHADLDALLAERMTGGERVDVVAMTAAVADYQPAGVYQITRRDPSLDPAGGQETWIVQKVGGDGQGKFKSSFDQVAFRATRTTKLIDKFRTDWRFTGTLIKFKLEVGLSDAELLRLASASRTASRADLMVANTLEMARPAQGEGAAFLIDDQRSNRVARSQMSAKITQWVAHHTRSHSPGATGATGLTE